MGDKPFSASRHAGCRKINSISRDAGGRARQQHAHILLALSCWDETMSEHPAAINDNFLRMRRRKKRPNFPQLNVIISINNYRREDGN